MNHLLRLSLFGYFVNFADDKSFSSEGKDKKNIFNEVKTSPILWAQAEHDKVGGKNCP